MSPEERKLMQIIDKIIIEGDPKKLAEIQQIDINTQLDGVWFYDICTSIEQVSEKPDIKINKFKKK
ncbi:MAG TPA: hypothetical protein EYN75_04205 [Candidatus Nitrosopelagicus sp.]|jgi:hypothetical protein|nr:hypothetical protein [Marine Group I thaumarchaeote]HIA10213.1 hypothetical protein [Candidatus Nitrosopelagicus sp.]HIA96686.1 hypothetical protein [Candidatus Nitrosopelagicus sp.]HIC06046.1 hypothetical protein [Candidatus Nitrosopelagicus sp.]HIO85149.1 hypothetical protein [Candidatus Nitrosopelagicus sp.]|tara:strand:+ start:1683 stop:1880 length:198 start_codon:yes stop_codon:yes gene_type:complete